MSVLLSSFRDFKNEKDWEWLRNDSPYSSALKFEDVGNDKYEMVVTKEWQSKVSISSSSAENPSMLRLIKIATEIQPEKKG